MARPNHADLGCRLRVHLAAVFSTRTRIVTNDLCHQIADQTPNAHELPFCCSRSKRNSLDCAPQQRSLRSMHSIRLSPVRFLYQIPWPNRHHISGSIHCHRARWSVGSQSCFCFPPPILYRPDGQNGLGSGFGTNRLHVLQQVGQKRNVITGCSIRFDAVQDQVIRRDNGMGWSIAVKRQHRFGICARLRMFKPGNGENVMDDKVSYVYKMKSALNMDT